MSKLLAERIALITGASRGIGAALALQLAQAGAHVVAVARTVGGLEELDDKIKAAGGSATLVPLDVKDSDGIARLALALNERYGRLDVLIGNSGRPPKGCGQASARARRAPCRRHDPKRPSSRRNFRCSKNGGGVRGACAPGKDRNPAATANGGSRSGRRHTKGSR